MKILVTGSAGFIGFHVTETLLKRGDEVIGLDNINDYYDPKLKFARLAQIGISETRVDWGAFVQSEKYENYQFIRLNLEDRAGIETLFETHQFDVVCHLAAQAGVRYSLENPHTYIQGNVVGFLHILEGCRKQKVEHLVYASSSSVYGLNKTIPFSTADSAVHPISLYAATKKSNELMAHTYSHLFDIPTTGLRFFTVYGPWGRPDMAYFLFTKAIIKGDVIKVFNHGKMERDFTYIDDIVEGIIRVIDKPAGRNTKWSAFEPSSASSSAPYRLYNIGSNSPINLLKFIETIEHKLGIKAEKQMLPMQQGDVYTTYADVADLMSDLGYKPSTPLNEGIEVFINWYKSYYHGKKI